MTREHLGGVVIFTILVPNDHITDERPELTSRYEIECVNIQIKSKRRVPILLRVASKYELLIKPWKITKDDSYQKQKHHVDGRL